MYILSILLFAVLLVRHSQLFQKCFASGIGESTVFFILDVVLERESG